MFIIYEQSLLIDINRIFFYKLSGKFFGCRFGILAQFRHIFFKHYLCDIFRPLNVSVNFLNYILFKLHLGQSMETLLRRCNLLWDTLCIRSAYCNNNLV